MRATLSPLVFADAVMIDEYYADLDCIIDDQLWTPGVWDGAKSLYSWGPPVPPSFLAPDDLAELMTGAHA